MPPKKEDKKDIDIFIIIIGVILILSALVSYKHFPSIFDTGQLSFLFIFLFVLFLLNYSKMDQLEKRIKELENG